MVDKGVDFNAQADPMLHLLQNATLTQSYLLMIQTGASLDLQAWSQGATSSIDAGDNNLSSLATSMAGLTTANCPGGSDNLSNDLMQMNALYNTMQTKYSNLNNQFSNVMQGGGTIVTDLTQVEQQALQLAQVTVDFMNALNQLIMSVLG